MNPTGAENVATPRAFPARVLLTGASRGIGAAIAQALIARGVRLALVGRDALTLARIAGDDSRHICIEADLAADDAHERIAERALAGLGGIDAFVSCAGIVEYASVGTIDRASVMRQAQVNWVAPLLLAQRIAPALELAGGASIVMIASTLGLKPAPLTTAYAATKAALISITRSLALELGPRGIRVNAIAPGVVDTEMVRVVRPSAAEVLPSGQLAQERIAEQLDHLARLHPLKRLGNATEIAESVVYVLGAPYLNGAVLPIDGGLLLGSGDP